MATWSEFTGLVEDWLWTQGPGGFWRIVVTATVIYLVALLVVRVGKKRFIGRNTVFDAILGFMLGSTLARTINGSAPLVASVAAAFVLVGLHWVFGEIASRSDGFSRLVSGKPHVIVRDGNIDHKELHRHNLSHADLEGALHMAGAPSVDEVELARFERDGSISVIPKRFARVVDVEVEDGVKTVRVVLEGRG